MAKRKKSRKTSRSAGQPSASLMRQIGAALEMVEEGEEESAYLKLHQMVQRNPRSKLALTTYLELCQDMDRWQPFAYYSEQLLQNEPDCVPALNNLSFTQFTIGNVEEAKRTAQKVLDRDPVNFHALGNLVRYHFLTAEFDEAHSFAERLKQISGDHSDLEKKRAEAFAFLGDDRQVWATYERANEKQEELSSLHLHLAAAASYRLGDQKTAWKLWRQAFKILPSF